MRWYSPNDWIPGPETEEELEELKIVEMEAKSASGKQSLEQASQCKKGSTVTAYIFWCIILFYSTVGKDFLR